MMHPDLENDVATLLEETQTAHSVYEAESLSGYDEEWPTWYAAYLLDLGLRALLPRTLTDNPGDLAARLEDVQAAFQRDDPSGDWCRFSAKHLVASERDARAGGHDTDRGQR